MTRTKFAVAACVAGLGMSALAAPAAHAAGPNQVHGGCSFATTNAFGDGYTGVLYEASVTTTGDTPPQPIGATVTCWLTVNGVEAPGTRHTYADLPGVTGVQAGADTAAYYADDLDPVNVCEAVAFADGTTQEWCSVDVRDPIPPQEVFDFVDGLVHYVECGDDGSDFCPIGCRFTKLLAGAYGPLLITPEGDVYVVDPLSLGLNPIYDCPPYINP